MGWASLTTMCVENLKAFICVCTCVLVHVYSCASQGSCWISSSVFLFLETGSLTDSGQPWALESLPLLPQCRVRGAGSGSQDCLASTLLTKPAPQSPTQIFCAG